MRIRVVSAFIAIITLSACNSESFSLQAVDPKLDATTVVKATNERQTIMAALYQDASFGVAQTEGSVTGKMPLNAFDSASWYETTLAGFNFVDDQCSDYFSQLYELDRNSRATVAGLGAFAQTASAILAVTGADVLTITSVAQAFGLATSLTQITANSFLYRLPPAATRDFVRSTMGAYREGVAQEANSINNPAIAYSYIRGYLDLCLPVTIEGMLVDTVSSIEATPGTAAGGRVGISLASSAGAPAALNEPTSTQETLQRSTPTPLGTAEQTLSPVTIKRIQVFLCLNNIDGEIGPQTRQAMADFFTTYGPTNINEPVSDILGGNITLAELETLKGKIRYKDDDADPNNDTEVYTCDERGVANAREVGLKS